MKRSTSREVAEARREAGGAELEVDDGESWMRVQVEGVEGMKVAL